MHIHIRQTEHGLGVLEIIGHKEVVVERLLIWLAVTTGGLTTAVEEGLGGRRRRRRRGRRRREEECYSHCCYH